MSNSTRSRQLHERGRAGIPKLIERLFAIEGPCARAIFLYCDKWDIEIADVVALMPGRLKARWYMKTDIDIGSRVRLKKSVAGSGYRQHSVVRGWLKDVEGGLVLADYLDGFRCWNVEDLERVPQLDHSGDWTQGVLMPSFSSFVDQSTKQSLAQHAKKTTEQNAMFDAAKSVGRYRDKAIIEPRYTLTALYQTGLNLSYGQTKTYRAAFASAFADEWSARYTELTGLPVQL